MRRNSTESMGETVDAVYRSESRRVPATRIRRLGDFDLAEEALHDAFRAAREQWPRTGVPARIPPTKPQSKPARAGSIEVRPIRPIRETLRC